MAVAAFHISGWPLHGHGILPYNSRGTPQNVAGWFALAILPPHAALMMFFVITDSCCEFRWNTARGKCQPRPCVYSAAIFRIYPIVIFGTIVTALLWGSLALHGDSPLAARHVVANLFLIDVSMNGVLWALQVEMLMAPAILILYFLERSRGPYALLGIALVTTALAYKPGWALWPPLSTNVFPFVLGMVVPTLGRRFARTSTKRAVTCWAPGAVVALMLPGVCFGLYTRHAAVVEAYGAAVLVSLAAYRHDVAVFKCLDARPLRFSDFARVVTTFCTWRRCRRRSPLRTSSFRRHGVPPSPWLAASSWQRGLSPSRR